MQIIFVMQYQQKTPNENCDHMNGEKNKEKEKMPVISTANTVVNPGTVMIESLFGRNGVKSNTAEIVYYLVPRCSCRTPNNANILEVGKIGTLHTISCEWMCL